MEPRIAPLCKRIVLEAVVNPAATGPPGPGYALQIRVWQALPLEYNILPYKIISGKFMPKTVSLFIITYGEVDPLRPCRCAILRARGAAARVRFAEQHNPFRCVLP
jgi:hypothetical protein